MELMPSLDGMRETMRHRLTQAVLLVTKNWLPFALTFGSGWLVGQFLPEFSGQDSKPQIAGIVTVVTERVPDFAGGHWAMLLYPRTSLMRQASSEEKRSS